METDSNLHTLMTHVHFFKRKIVNTFTSKQQSGFLPGRISDTQHNPYFRKFSRSSRLHEDQERSLGFLPFTHSPDIM